MVQRKVNSRDIIFQVLAADAVTYLTVGGLKEISVNKGDNSETTVTTTYDSGGLYEGEIMQRGASMKLDGFLLKDSSTGAQDPGQARLEVIGTAVGVNSLGGVRFRYPTDSLWTVWAAAFVELGEQGGGNNDKSGWSCTVTRSGASTTTSAP